MHTTSTSQDHLYNHYVKPSPPARNQFGGIAKKLSFKESFAAFESNKSAEEIIEEIRNARISTRKIEDL